MRTRRAAAPTAVLVALGLTGCTYAATSCQHTGTRSLSAADHARFHAAAGHELELGRLHTKLDEQARLAADTIQRTNSTKSEESLAKLVKRVASWSGRMGQSFEDIAQERAVAELGKPKLVLAASARIIRSMSRAVLQEKSPEPGAREHETAGYQGEHEDALLLPKHLLEAATLVLKSQEALMSAIIQLGARQGSLPDDASEPELSSGGADAVYGGEEGELVTLLADLDISPDEWLVWKHEMLDDGYTIAEIEMMQTELTAVRGIVSELYGKQMRLNARVKTLLKQREQKLDAAVRVLQASPSPTPQPLESVPPADEAVHVALVEDVEHLEQLASAAAHLEHLAADHAAVPPASVAADEAGAEAVEPRMPLLRVADNSKAQLMSALEKAQRSILGVLSPRSRSLVLATPPPNSDLDDAEAQASSQVAEAQVCSHTAAAPQSEAREAVEHAVAGELELQEEGYATGEQAGVAEDPVDAPTPEEWRRQGEPSIPLAQEHEGGAAKGALEVRATATEQRRRPPPQVSLVTSAAIDAAREAAGSAAMQDAKERAAMGEFAAARAARNFAAAQFALARQDMAAELLVLDAHIASMEERWAQLGEEEQLELKEQQQELLLEQLNQLQRDLAGGAGVSGESYGIEDAVEGEAATLAVAPADPLPSTPDVPREKAATKQVDVGRALSSFVGGVSKKWSGIAAGLRAHQRIGKQQARDAKLRPEPQPQSQQQGAATPSAYEAYEKAEQAQNAYGALFQLPSSPSSICL